MINQAPRRKFALGGKPPKTMPRRPTKYDRDQHQLIASLLGVSDSPKAPGLTAYEAVCDLRARIHAAQRTAKLLTGVLHKKAIPPGNPGRGLTTTNLRTDHEI